MHTLLTQRLTRQSYCQQPVCALSRTTRLQLHRLAQKPAKSTEELSAITTSPTLPRLNTRYADRHHAIICLFKACHAQSTAPQDAAIPK